MAVHINHKSETWPKYFVWPRNPRSQKLLQVIFPVGSFEQLIQATHMSRTIRLTLTSVVGGDTAMLWWLVFLDILPMCNLVQKTRIGMIPRQNLYFQLEFTQLSMREAQGARALFIWTDCDREGEHIGGEIRTEAFKKNARMEVKRASFSNIERA